MFKLIISLIAPLTSLFILLLGNGLFNTLISLRLGIDNASSWVLGAVTAFYYIGMTIGAFRVEKFISRVGHVRSFACFASVTAVVTLLPGMILSPYVWMGLRFICGYCIAGLYVVIESWILAACTVETRGKILSVYLMSLYCSQALGQLLLKVGDPKTITPFCIVAILSSLSVLPVCMTYRTSPEIETVSTLNFFKIYQISPSGMMGCFISGLVLAAIHGLVPAYTDNIGFSVEATAYTMFTIILGGTLLQYPFGHISDIFDRRKVLLSVSIITAILSLSLILTAQLNEWIFLILCFFFGGASFVLYPLAMSHLCDRLDPKDVVAATSSLVLSYGLGASLGPMIAPIFISNLGDQGLFIFIAASASYFAAFIIWRMTQRAAPPRPAQQQFIAVSSTTPIANELDPRAELSEEFQKTHLAQNEEKDDSNS